MAAVAEHELDGREFVVGDEVTIADFVLAYTLDGAGEARLLDEFLRLRAYVERMLRASECAAPHRRGNQARTRLRRDKKRPPPVEGGLVWIP